MCSTVEEISTVEVPLHQIPTKDNMLRAPLTVLYAIKKSSSVLCVLLEFES